MVGTKLTTIENNKDQIDGYQNVRTELIVTPKCKDQNSVFAFIRIKRKKKRIKESYLLTSLI